MKHRSFWIVGAVAILAVIIVPAVLFWPRSTASARDPQASVPQHPVHTDHTDIIEGPFDSPQDVTKACLSCHPNAATEFMQTTHWTWEGKPVEAPWRNETVTIGKANLINNFCIGIQGNQKKCTSCHAGYGWKEDGFDFADPLNVDCLVCHADTSTYAKGDYGYPTEDIDLLAAAKSVRAPTRENCGKCHFDGGGGNNVKHGELEEALLYPSEDLDVHMGKGNFLCTDCHRTESHQIKGRLLSDNLKIDPAEQVACTDCHDAEPHQDERINLHTKSVACQTCHVPTLAPKNPTKTEWDWSTAGEDHPEDHFTFLKIKGSFIYANDVMPSYGWFDGSASYRYLLGDTIDPSRPTLINPPEGSIKDPNSKIFPFKLHKANQPYDTQHNYLLQPITAGKDGFWTNFNWDQAFELAEKYTGLDYSGSYGFAETWMYWPSTHMVQPKENALQCDACHGDGERLDWQALGYPGDPMEWGGRFSKQ